MLIRALFAAILAGIAAGLVMTTIQHFRTTPLILKAEIFEETAGHGHKEAENTAEHKKSETNKAQSIIQNPNWEPNNGFERTLYSFLTGILATIGLALVLTAISLLINIPITPSNGVVWGLLAFMVFTLSPSAGLPPELPAMPAADLTERQIWWWGTIVSGAFGVGLIALRGGLISVIIAIILFTIPHFIGAPQPEDHETSIPAYLIQNYVANSLFIMAITWVVMGTVLGYAMKMQNLIKD